MRLPSYPRARAQTTDFVHKLLFCNGLVSAAS